jgi:hypothetical protein
LYEDEVEKAFIPNLQCALIETLTARFVTERLPEDSRLVQIALLRFRVAVSEKLRFLRSMCRLLRKKTQCGMKQSSQYIQFTQHQTSQRRDVTYMVNPISSSFFTFTTPSPHLRRSEWDGYEIPFA